MTVFDGDDPACPTEDRHGTSNQRVRLLIDIYDDGADHHPPGYIARKGEVLVVRTVRSLGVSHEGVENRQFAVREGEFELIPPVETSAPNKEVNDLRNHIFNGVDLIEHLLRDPTEQAKAWAREWCATEITRSAEEPKSTQPPDSRGDAALWVLAWLAMKGGLGSDVHEVIEAVMEGRAEMRPNNKLHIEPRGAEKASECICPKRDTDDSIIYTHVACPTHALNGSANEGKS